MTSSLKKLTGMGGDVRKIAALLQKKAPPGHKLAYITEEEAQILKDRGGSGRPHEDTGIPSYEVEDTVQEQFGDFQPGGQTPQEVAASNADLYPRGELPQEPYTGTVFYPSERGMANVQPTATQQDIQNAYLAATTAPGDISLPPRTPTGREAFEMGAALGPEGAAPKPPAEPSLADQLSKTTGLSKDTLGRLGMAGLTGLLGARQAGRAAEAGQAGAQQMKALAAPYQQQGAQLQAQAQRGELTPAAQQSLRAMQAQAAQGIERRGGVGVMQAQQEIENLRQRLLQQQYDFGLKLSGIGDNIALGAIRTGMQADQYVNQLTSTYFNNIARIAAGGTPAEQTATRGATTQQIGVA